MVRYVWWRFIVIDCDLEDELVVTLNDNSTKTITFASQPRQLELKVCFVRCRVISHILLTSSIFI
jgi:hypothetical protein